MTTPVPEGFELKNKVQELSDAITAKHPRMSTLLHEIWKTLKAYPENVTLLAEEDIQKIVAGLELQTQTKLAATITKGSSKSSLAKKLANIDDDAF